MNGVTIDNCDDILFQVILSSTFQCKYMDFIRVSTGYVKNSHNDLFPVGLLANLVEQRWTGIEEMIGSSSGQARIFSGFIFIAAYVDDITAHNCS